MLCAKICDTRMKTRVPLIVSQVWNVFLLFLRVFAVFYYTRPIKAPFSIQPKTKWRCSYHLYQDHNKFLNPYLTKNNSAKVSPSILFVISYRLKSTEWRNVISVESDAGIQGTRMRQELYIRLFVFFSKLYNPIL